MTRLLQRLRAAGLDEGYVRAWLLPDWWDDEVAENPSGLSMAEMYIARMTGLSIQALRSDAPLELAPQTLLRFKKRADADADEVRPAAVIAERVANGVVEAVNVPRSFSGPLRADEIRRRIRATWRTVNLPALVDFAWNHGVIVAHIAELPRGSKRFDGIAMFVGAQPVVLLASGRDSPAWLAFDLAHELGHVFSGHVAEGSEAMTDFNLESRSDDPDEVAANRFALQVLTGDPDLHLQAVYGLTGARLAAEAQRVGPTQGADPGALALIYGWMADRIPAAQSALRLLKETAGAHEIIAEGLRRHLREDLPESIQMLVDLVTEAEGAAMPADLLLIDNDAFVLLAGSGHLERVLGYLNMRIDQCRRLPTFAPVFRKKIAERLPKEPVIRIENLARRVAPLEFAPGAETFDTLRSAAGIDVGEAVLYGVLAERDSALLTTNDKRSMRTFFEDPSLEAIRRRVAGRVIPIEGVARRLVIDHGVAAIAPGFLEAAAVDTFLRVAFSQATITAPGACMEAIESYLNDLRQVVGEDFLYDL